MEPHIYVFAPAAWQITMTKHVNISFAHQGNFLDTDTYK